MTNSTKCKATFTSIYSSKVAKSYEIEAGKLVKKAADTLKTGYFKTVSVISMAGLRGYLDSLSPGSVLLAGVNKDAEEGKIGFGPDCYQLLNCIQI
jgi:hypothetical protein